MDIKDILSVGLTAEDFDICIQGLDAIPDITILEETLRGTIEMMISTMGNDLRKNEAERKFDQKLKAAQEKNAGRKDDLVLLKSKLILLKRLLLSNDALRQANEILTPPYS
jgi:hypothetical protein